MTAPKAKFVHTPISSADVARMTGFTIRWVQTHAANGDIPSAHQLVDGGEWKFDEAAVTLWKESRVKVREEWRPFIKEKARKSGGGASSTAAANSANLLKQRLGLLR